MKPKNRKTRNKVYNIDTLLYTSKILRYVTILEINKRCYISIEKILQNDGLKVITKTKQKKYQIINNLGYREILSKDLSEQLTKKGIEWKRKMIARFKLRKHKKNF